MSNHTPGPWAVHPFRAWVIPALKPDWPVCQIRHPAEDIPEHVAMANACLIAAAPDLLEALNEALTTMESDWLQIDGEWGSTFFGDLEGAVERRDPSTDAIRKARAAIAKAESR